MRTQHKGISIKVDEDGSPVAYKVFVQWAGEVRETTVRFIEGDRPSALDTALERRQQFELELRKPRSERQISTAGDGVHIRKKCVIASLGHRSQRAFGFAAIGRRAAMEKAKQVRRAAGFPY